ncbi:hypothetical protein AB0B66_38400 [Catellatospora sp. NPDC049111]|uniref:hypothetical protein n=1 Tax=Catellatospora sp. NPDC049111 TaxID=3155271 RepID=UPI0034052DF0
MRDPGPPQGRLALRSPQDVLCPHAAAGWSVPAGPLDWTCHDTAAHIAHDLTAYAPPARCRPRRRPRALRPDRAAHGRPRAAAADRHRSRRAAGRRARRRRPGRARLALGPGDPSGFAAMGTAETPPHTHDITRSLDPSWAIAGELAALILHRLLPDAPAGDPADVLLWCTGRGGLPGHPRRTSWSWRAARP